MDWIFADDARQATPSRKRTGPLVGMGGVTVPAAQVGPLERAIKDLCKSVGFPDTEEFKWSPGKTESFQKTQLVGEPRAAFYGQLFQLAAKHEAKALVVIEDESKNMARQTSTNHEHDVTALFLERSNWELRQTDRDGVVVAAAPHGGTKGQGKFAADCAALIQSGTEFVQFERLPLGVLIVKSSELRCLQLADVVTSCVVARVSGESTYSPPIFELIKPLLRSDGHRVGGVGLKIHPDFLYGNLYHWLLGDTHFYKWNCGSPMPLKDRPFATDAGEVAYTLAAAS